ncbi:MAG: Fe(2+)-trafficking protein [Planctomycetota bacterium]|nr:Fe(2+)-trafficking protein [Planctomycetota bacterium]
MTDLDDRIARFENMSVADPSNDMAHFSLGSAYFDAERFEEAANSFNRCIALNPDMTRAMELGGASFLKIGKVDEAKTLLEQGYVQAVSRGEKRVQDGISVLMQDAGLELPEVEQSDTAGKSGKPLSHAPLPGEIGKWILDNIDEEQWNAWIGQGTKVINELRLDFSREEDQKTYEDYMIEFLGIPQEVVAKDKESVS